MFFPPCFRAESEITIWGPASPEASLEDRIARYISAPLSPVEVRELPCSVSFRDTPATEWEIGGGDDPRRGGHPPRADARLPDHRRRDDARLHPRPRAGPRGAARRPRARVDLGLRPRPRRRPADPRLPVHGRRVPRPRRLGPLRAVRHAHIRQTGRRHGGSCSSTTTRSTRTSSSTTSAPRRSRRGRASGATRPSSSWAWRAPSSRLGPRSRLSTPERPATSTTGTSAGAETFDTGITTCSATAPTFNRDRCKRDRRAAARRFPRSVSDRSGSGGSYR